MVSHGKIHAIAHCRDCDWREEDYNIAQRKAREHAKKFNHIIDVEVGIWHVIGETS